MVASHDCVKGKLPNTRHMNTFATINLIFVIKVFYENLIYWVLLYWDIHAK